VQLTKHEEMNEALERLVEQQDRDRAEQQELVRETERSLEASRKLLTKLRRR
jgi:hypothetical protein